MPRRLPQKPTFEFICVYTLIEWHAAVVKGDLIISNLYIFITASPREALANLFIFSLMNSAFGYAFLEKIKILQTASSDLREKNVQSRDYSKNLESYILILLR